MKTTENEMDEALGELHGRREQWARLDLREKIAMGQRLRDRVYDVRHRWASEALEAKGIRSDEPAASEEWLAGPVIVLRNLRLMLDSLEQVAAGRKPTIPGDIHTRTGGQVVAEVFPASGLDRLMYMGFEAQVWMKPDVTKDTLRETQAVFYDRPDPEGRVDLVLGAGNVSSIPPLDVLYKLYVEGAVCLLKMNPVNEYLGPIFEEMFGEFVERGFLRFAYGGADVGAYLCQHELVEEIHITGSDKTHDAIVYGPSEGREERKANDERVVDKPISSELGNVSPIVVVPGAWEPDEIRFHAENIATQLANNAGFNCNAARVLVTWSDWPQREEFLEELRSVFEKIDSRCAYYPGADERFDRFVGEHSERARVVGRRTDGRLPFALIEDVDPSDEDDIVFTTEAWTTVMAETALTADDTGDFLDKAVRFCNDHVWGTLNAALIVHPTTEEEWGEALDRAVADLRYGSIAINHWPALSYALGVTTWGAYPGHTYQNIQSGIGVVHNTLMFDRPQKSVVRGPFTMKPKPPWFATNKMAHRIAPKLTDFEYDPGLLRFASVAIRSLFG